MKTVDDASFTTIADPSFALTTIESASIFCTVPETCFLSPWAATAKANAAVASRASTIRFITSPLYLDGLAFLPFSFNDAASPEKSVTASANETRDRPLDQTCATTAVSG